MSMPADRAAVAGTPAVPPLHLIAVVAAGGMVGALARYAVELLLPWGGEGWPWAIFLVNVLGCFAIGIATGALVDAGARGARVPRWWRPLVVTGFLGGFTTFSTYIVEVVTLAGSGASSAAVLALSYLVGSVMCGVIAAWAGLRLADRVPWRIWDTDVDIG